jgi:hypothetical protein
MVVVFIFFITRILEVNYNNYFASSILIAFYLMPIPHPSIHVSHFAKHYLMSIQSAAYNHAASPGNPAYYKCGIENTSSHHCVQKVPATHQNYFL